jgi:hypothetical protein
MTNVPNVAISEEGLQTLFSGCTADVKGGMEKGDV